MRTFLGLVLLLCFSPLQAASFDCAKASTRMEKLICADEVLSKLDEALNLAYKRALKTSNSSAVIKAWQRDWLKSWKVTGCETSLCLLKAFAEQILLLGSLASTDEGASAWTGRYHQLINGRKDSDSASLLLVGLTEDRVFILAFAVQGPTAHTGEIRGLAQLMEEKLVFDLDGCRAELRLDSKGPVVEQESGCGGMNVSFVGEYRAD